MVRKLTIEELPKEIVDSIMDKIYKHPKYIELSRKKAMYLKNGNYFLAMETTKAMEKVIKECLSSYIKHYEGECKKINELSDSMTDEDRDMMSALGNSIVMMADCLETICMDCNELLKKYHPDFRIEMFDKLVELANEARNHVRLIDGYENSDYYYNLYGDSADKLKDMIVNKGRSFVNKLKAYEKRNSKKNKKGDKTAA